MESIQSSQPSNLFDQLLALTQEGDQLRLRTLSLHANPEELILQTNELAGRCIKFMQTNPYVIESLNDFKEFDEYKKFIALLAIIGEIGMKIARLMIDRYSITREFNPDEQAALGHLTNHFGQPVELSDLEKLLHPSGNLPDLVRNLTRLRLFLNSKGLDILIHPSTTNPLNPKLLLGSTELPHELKEKYRARKLPNGIPSLKPFIHRQRIRLNRGAIRNKDKAAQVRAEALERAKNTVRQKEYSGWIPKRTNLTETISKVPELTPSQISELLEGAERHIRRCIISIKRDRLSYPEQLVETLESIRIPAELEDEPKAHEILKIIQIFALLFDHSEIAPDTILPKTIRDILFEITSENTDLSWYSPVGNSDEPEGDDQSEIVDELCDTYGEITFRDVQSFYRIGETSSEVTIPANYGTDMRTIFEDENPVNTRFNNNIRYSARKFLSSGEPVRKILALVEKCETDPATKLQLMLFALNIAQKITQRKVPDYPKPQGLLIPTPPSVNIHRFSQTIDTNSLPEHLWRQQVEAMQAVNKGLKKGLSKMFIEAPPGSGKTEDMVILIENLNPDGHTLILTPSVALAEQTAEVMSRRLKIPRKEIGVVAEEKAVFDQDITIATYSSFQKYAMAGLFDPREYDLVILDEAHRSLSDQRALIADIFREAIVIGTTASSQDIKGRNVSDEMTPIYRISLPSGLRAGISNPTRWWNFNTQPNLEAKAETALQAYIELCNNEQAMILFDTISACEDVAKYFKQRAGIDAIALHSQTKDVGKLDQEFRSGQHQVMLACDMFTEGWDYPALRWQIMGDIPRKTWLFLQKFGRIIRTSAEKEHSGLITLSVPKSKDLKIIEKTFRINPFSHTNGDLLITPDSSWPSNPFLI